jgi:hypothetical protein
MLNRISDHAKYPQVKTIEQWHKKKLETTFDDTKSVTFGSWTNNTDSIELIRFQTLWSFVDNGNQIANLWNNMQSQEEEEKKTERQRPYLDVFSMRTNWQRFAEQLHNYR